MVSYICSNGYSIFFDSKNNQITIHLPQTMETITNTLEPVSNRNVDMTTKDLSTLLELTKLIFEGDTDA